MKCLLVTAVALVGLSPTGHCSALHKPPNIVVFLADDHGYADSSVYGSKQITTPNMERIAKAGATFTHMFVASPSCAPSRAALLTGLMPARNGAEANHSAPHASITTLPTSLRRLGYFVAAFGKVAHYKMADRFGFDHVDPKHATDSVRTFLKTRDATKPLCLFVGTHKPHVPWPEKEGYDPMKLRPPPNCVSTPETREYLAKYYTAVTRMDRELGEIHDLVRAHFKDDVLFLYLSDHGAQWPFGKWNLYDSGIRVPFLAVWPGHITPGIRSDALISSVDLLPTFVELAGGEAPKNLDGRSFANLLHGQAKEHRDEIYASHTNDGRFNVYPSRCLRTHGFAYILNMHPDWAHTTHIDLAQPQDGLGYWLSWKASAKKDATAAALVNRYHERPKEELYDVQADPWQLKNLANEAEHAERLRRMRARLADWMRAQGDESRVLVDPRRLSDPESWQNPIKAAPKKKLPSENRLRLIIETDAGGDPDDEQSLVRFLLYANEFDIEGIIVNRAKARDKENRNAERTGLAIVRRLIEAYGECYPNLVKHDPRYPTPELLWKRTVPAYEGHDDGVKLILATVDADDPRPLWFSNWGTDKGSAPSSLKLALDHVLKERGEKGYAAFKNRLRLSSSDEFGEHTSRVPPFKLWVDTFRPELDKKRWYHRFSALTATAGGFDLKRDVLTGHGPLGALYPTNTGLPQKEGDTMTFLYLVPTGMNDPDQPTWGSWAGRYGPNPNFSGKAYYWANQADEWQGTTHRDNTLKRWAADLQNDFRARLDWCVRSHAEANHPPVVVANGEKGTSFIHLKAAPGKIKLSAKGSSDPEGHKLSYAWFVYREAGSYRGEARISAADSPEALLHVPADAVGSTIHVVVTVTDDGVPPLTRYRRMVVTCTSSQ